MMTLGKWSLLLLVLLTLMSNSAEARRHKKQRYKGPPPTHPMVLWSRTLAESTDKDQRKIAAYKLSQYSQTIFQDSIVNNLLRCTTDKEIEIKVLCTKALGRAGTAYHSDKIRRALLEVHENDPGLRNTVVRVFIVRKDNTPKVHDALLDALKKSTDEDELIVLLNYFAEFGNSSGSLMDAVAATYNRIDDVKVKRSAVKVLADKGTSQDSVVDLLSTCATSKDTPLALNCLYGLQRQSKKDSRAWAATEKTIESDDPDVLLETLNVIIALPESPHPLISKRLVELSTEMEDSEIREKAVLALEVCGDSSDEVIQTLSKLIADEKTDEAVRIASVLVLGKQAPPNVQEFRDQLSKCVKESKSQSLRTACQLSLNDLTERKKNAAKAVERNTATAKDEKSTK